MGNIGFSARVVYGTGLFMTISPSERHNGLAIRLSRYREGDPLVSTPGAAEERRWIGKDAPRLQPEGDEEVIIDVPEYDVRRPPAPPGARGALTSDGRAQVFIELMAEEASKQEARS